MTLYALSSEMLAASFPVFDQIKHFPILTFTLAELQVSLLLVKSWEGN